MIIDFHTHVFPEAIASATVEKLESFAHIKAQSDGLLKGLKASMEEAGVDYSVILPVVTKPSQFHTVNEYAASINGREGIISFGGIHPDSADYRKELEQIRDYGLPGIKLHPDYQKVHVTDPRYLRLITYAVDLGLIVTLHAGMDIGLPEEIHCPPEESLQMLQYVEAHAAHPEQSKIILAHTGGYAQWDDVEALLVGTHVYFDLAYTFGHIETGQLLRIIQNHGADRILFATDSPWNGQKADIAALKALGLPPEEEAAILGGNAKALLKL
ncbi:MAG: amidohydrolase family protein [Bacteroides sp.]|nr:amidohydrolase family protein [Bacteroides sp.]MCM1548522.1 amidohydrolase family protein [Clostridium sp.]